MSNNLPILYSFVRCPYAMRVRLAMLEARINCIMREVDIKNKPKDRSATNIPKRTVPVLLLTSGKIIDESLDIIHYALNKDKHLSIQNCPEKEQLSIKALIDSNDIEFVKLLRPYKYPERYPDLSQAACKQEIQDKFLNKYEQMLKDKPFLFGLKSIADIAIFPFIRQFFLVDRSRMVLC